MTRRLGCPRGSPDAASFHYSSSFITTRRGRRLERAEANFPKSSAPRKAGHHSQSRKQPHFSFGARRGELPLYLNPPCSPSSVAQSGLPRKQQKRLRCSTS